MEIFLVLIAAKIRRAKKRAHQEWIRLVSDSEELNSPLSPRHQFSLDPDEQIKVSFQYVYTILIKWIGQVITRHVAWISSIPNSIARG